MGESAEVAPLIEIEQSVKERAKDLTLDLAAPEGVAGLRALIDQEILRWNEDHKRGLRPFELIDTEQLAERSFRNLAGYGPLTELLADNDVWEIMVNAPDATFS